MTTKADAYLPTERGHGRELKIEEGRSKNKGGGVPHLDSGAGLWQRPTLET